MTRHSFVRRFRLEESGQTAVMAAIMLPVLIAFVGLALDVGYAFDYRRQMQNAADSAAVAGAFAVKADGAISASALANVVNLDAAQNGFTSGTGGISITVCRPAVDLDCPTLYTYTPASRAVKVTISQPKATFFTRIINFTSLTIGVDAVAAATSGDTSNVVILDTTCTSGAFTASGGSNVTADGSIYVNSCGAQAIKAGGGGDVIATQGIFVGCNAAGTCGGYDASGGSTFTPIPVTGKPQIADPLASLPEPTPTGPNYPDPNISSGTWTLNPGIYPGITISGGTVTFSPGNYFINGNKLNFKNTATVLGSGVFFYAYNNALLNIANSGTHVTMSAPSSGTYRGIWYFQQRSDAKDAVVSGAATLNVTGVIYISAPSSKLTFSGGSTSGSSALYTVFVVWNLVFGGGGYFHADFSSIGGSPLDGNSGVALAE